MVNDDKNNHHFRIHHIPTFIADLSREVGRFENPAYESTGWVLHSVLTNTLLTIDDCENVSDILTKSKCNNYE